MNVGKNQEPITEMGDGEYLVNHMFNSRILLRIYPLPLNQPICLPLKCRPLKRSIIVQNTSLHHQSTLLLVTAIAINSSPQMHTPSQSKEKYSNPHIHHHSRINHSLPHQLCHVKPTHANASKFHQLIRQIKSSSEKGKYDGIHHQGATLGYSTTS